MVLMKECGWLTVKQLMAYHSLMQVHKTIQSQVPVYLYSRVTTQLALLDRRSSYNYKTRQEASGALRQIPAAEARLDLADRSWCWSATKTYHNLPTNIKREVKMAKFKAELKTWLRSNIEPN